MANDRLRQFGAGYSIQVGRTGGDVFGLELLDQVTGTPVSIVDVGFGISQVLQIIVQSTVSTDSVVLVEQPELHLHPRLQAELGSLFADCVGDPYRNQFIIETHSEHLILRIQRLIREGKLKNSDVSVVYVMKSEEGSQCYPLRLDEEGDFIDEWPEGFFEEGFRERFAE